MWELLENILKGVLKGIAVSAVILLCFLIFEPGLACAVCINMIMAFFPAVSIINLVRTVRILKHGVRAEGTVTGNTMCGRDTLSVIKWDTPDGEVSGEFGYHSRLFGGAGVGESVTVVYIPDDPDRACIEKYSLKRSICFTVFFTGLSICILIWTILFFGMRV